MCFSRFCGWHKTTSIALLTTLCAMALSVATTSSASASTCAGATITFDGDTNSFWDVANNWDSNSLPLGTDDVCIPTGKTAVVRNAFAVANAVAVEGALHVTGGTLTATSSSPTVSVTNSGEIHVDATGTISAPAVALQDNSTLTLAGGTLTGDLDASALTQITAWGNIGGSLNGGGEVVVGEHLSTTARTLHIGGNFPLSYTGHLVLDWLDNDGVAGVDYDLVQVVGSIDFFEGELVIDNPTVAKLGDGKSFTPLTYSSRICIFPTTSLNGVSGVSVTLHINPTNISVESSGTPPSDPPTPDPPTRDGYWLAMSDGQVLNYNTDLHGSLGAIGLNGRIVDIAATHDGNGYWLVGSDGGVFAFGSATFHGSMGGVVLNAPIVDIAPTPDGQGYYLVASDGGVFAFGSAAFLGSMGGVGLNAPVVAMAVNADGTGYWLAAADGGVFAFNALFSGSAASQRLNAPIVDIAADHEGSGYWLAASDGGIFSYGAAFAGSAEDVHPSGPVVGMVATDDGSGYRLAGADGGVFSYNANFHGSAVDTSKTADVVGIAGFGVGLDVRGLSETVGAAC